MMASYFLESDRQLKNGLVLTASYRIHNIFIFTFFLLYNIILCPSPTGRREDFTQGRQTLLSGTRTVKIDFCRIVLCSKVTRRTTEKPFHTAMTTPFTSTVFVVFVIL